MSDIRRQSIISSALVYIGFALGFLNTYLFTYEGGFTPSQYGLTGAFIAIANIMMAVSNLGMIAYTYKFYPYYKDNLPPSRNDMMTWALFVSVAGFMVVILASFVFRDLIIRKFSANSPDLVSYFNWILPFGFGLTIYSLIEAFAWQVKKSVVTNYLREIQFRLFTTILIVLFFTGVIYDFDLFVKIYACTYILLALILITYLVVKRKLYFPLTISRVTKKFFKKIVSLALFFWGGGLIFNVANVFDTIVIAAVMPDGLAYAAIYTLAQNIASLVQAPQRGIVSASIGPLAQAWKDKDLSRIKRIYQRSSINQLIFAVGAFLLIWINFTDGVLTFNLNERYLPARYIFLFIGVMRIIDMGTGVNSQIIGTSTYWRFEFFTGLILLSIALPLNYFLTREIGVYGPAISNLIAFTVYNAIRYFFLLRKFKLQPFSPKTFYTVGLGLTCFLICHLIFSNQYGFEWIVMRSFTFMTLYMAGVWYLNLSPDILPVLSTIRRRVLRK